MGETDNSKLAGGKPIFVGALERAFPVIRDLEAEGIETHSFHLTEEEVFGPFTPREVLAAGAKADLSYARKRFTAEVGLNVILGELIIGSPEGFKEFGDSPVVAVLVSEGDYERANLTLFGTTSAGPFPGEYDADAFDEVDMDKLAANIKRTKLACMVYIIGWVIVSILGGLLLILFGTWR